ncbi:helix-turn-helix transcriptional regulator [Chitinophaga solisilvae]|uniref:helix-turn-helix transcriptional regulator n=1 Tax=Chitinophaga solisilvae TaxID=1233460 RepID=UPI00136B4F42|nr:YafY family protein [Chitinophaga solisilvae]
MNRFDRITAILIQLQSKKVVVAQEIADRFDISLRTVYRDIKSLEEAGVPVIGEKGLGYSIMEGYRLPPVMFTEEEIVAFLMAEKVLENYADIHNSELFKSAMFKIRAVLRSAEKTKLEQMEESISVRHKNAESNYLLNDTIPALLRGISEKRVLHIQYAQEDDTTTVHEIEPIGLFHEHGAWITAAWSHTLKTYRHFRTTRILTLQVTGKSFHKAHISMQEWFERTAPAKMSFPVQIRVKTRLVRYLQEQKYNYGFLREKEMKEYTEMHFDAPCIEAFSRWYITFADEADVIEPASLRTMLKERLQTVLKKIS